MSVMHVDMSQKIVGHKSLPDDLILGGRAMVDYLMTAYGDPTAHPLSEESPFIIATGLLGGTAASTAGRISIGGKSPLTGGIKEASSGGTAATKLGRLGICSIMVTGKSKEWQVLKIDKNGAVFEPVRQIINTDNYTACEKLREQYGEKIGIILIGPAGEKKMANSTVALSDLKGRPCRHAARGGLGAVMGAKGLKAIVIDDAGGSVRQPANDKAFKIAVKNTVKTIKSLDFVETLHLQGTPCFIYGDNERGSLPTRNFTQGSFDNYEKINAGTIMALNMKRGASMGHGCLPGCVVRCSFNFHDEKGDFLTSALEYETLGMLGANLGIDDIDAIARMDKRCDELGLDTIEMGGTIGILNDAGLFEFGDTAKAASFLEEIAQGTPLGHILGSGVSITAKVFGITRVPAIKGQCIPAHAARSLKGWAVSYASSPQGADHTAGCVTEDPLSSVGHTERSRKAQISAAALDSTGLCIFDFLEDNPEVIVEMINTFYGVDWNSDNYLEMGKKALQLERAFNLKAGIGPGADVIPNWMKKEPLPPTNAVFDVPQEEIDAVFDF